MDEMRAMQLEEPGRPLRRVTRRLPDPGAGELLIEVKACSVCRTDLHVCDGDIKGALPIVPDHEIVGRVVSVGPSASGLEIGDRVGVPWLGRTCGTCAYCRSGRENLCDKPLFTGFHRDGGFASHGLADAAFCFRIPTRSVMSRPPLCSARASSGTGRSEWPATPGT